MAFGTVVGSAVQCGSQLTVAHTPRVLNVRGFPGASIEDVRIYNSIFKEIKGPDEVIDADVKLVGCKLEQAK